MKNYTCVMIAAFLLLLLTGSVKSQTTGGLDPSLNHFFENFTGSVNAVAKQPDGKILVGGYFTLANTQDRFGLVRLNPDGTTDVSFNPAIGVYPTGVRAIAIQPDGKILVGGLFDTASTPFRCIVRLNADGSVDTTYTAVANNVVHAIALQSDGKIIIGGGFTNLNNATRFGTARLNSNGSLDTSFMPQFRTVFSIAIQPDGNILFGGSFISNGTPPINRIVRVSPTGAVDTAFVANASANNTVRTIKVQTDGKIVIGGSFTQINNVIHNSLARLNADGTLDNGFNPSLTGLTATSVESLDVDSSGKILVGGSFTAINGTARSNVGRLNADGSLDTTFTQQSGANMPVRSVTAESDGGAFIGGDFQIFDGLPKYRFVKLNPNGSLNSLFNADIFSNGYITAIETQPDGKIIVGGSFYYVDGTGYSSVVRFNANGTIDPTFATFAQTQYFADPVYDIEVQPDGKILIAGAINFSSNPQTFYNVVRLNSNGTVDNTFAPVIAPEVRKVKILPNSQILIGGVFTTVNNVSVSRLARLNSNGSLDSSFNSNITAAGSATILDIVLRENQKILIGGYFETVNGVSKSNIAQLNSDGTLDTSFTATVSSAVYSISAATSGSIFISGSFSSVNGSPKNNVAKLTATGQNDDSFNVSSNINLPHVVVKQYTDGKIIVAGQANYFTEVTNNVVIFNADGSTYSILQNSRWFNGAISDVNVQADGKVIFGGYFTKVGSERRFALARFNSLNFGRKTIFDFDGDAKTDIGIFRPSSGAWWVNSSLTNATTATVFGASTDKLVPGDYTGDGKTDVAFFRPSTGEWFILRSGDGSFYSFQFGAPGDIAAPGDYDADGKTDVAVFRPSSATWYVLRSSDGGVTIQAFGATEDQPVIADYDGDGKDDIAVFRPSTSVWWILKSSNNSVFAVQFGASGDKTASGDYTGDGKADIAFFRPSTGYWYILRSEDNSFYGFPFGTNGDIPTPGDYDGDGKFDAAVFRPSSSVWYVQRSTSGFLAVQFGETGDSPIPNAFVR